MWIDADERFRPEAIARHRSASTCRWISGARIFGERTRKTLVVANKLAIEIEYVQSGPRGCASFAGILALFHNSGKSQWSTGAEDHHPAASSLSARTRMTGAMSRSSAALYLSAWAAKMSKMRAETYQSIRAINCCLISVV